jgi:hypothetical protein
MARHAVVDLAQVLLISPNLTVDRLAPAEFALLQARLEAAGVRLRTGTGSEPALAELRATYEPFVSALAERVLVPLPPWSAPAGALDDWETSAWDDEFASLREKLNKVLHSR